MSKISKLDQNIIIKKIDKETVNVQVSDNEMLMCLVGQFDQNLKELAKLTDTSVFFRGNSITCKGKQDKVKNFCDAIKFLTDKYFLTKIIEKEDILSSVKNNIESDIYSLSLSSKEVPNLSASTVAPEFTSCAVWSGIFVGAVKIAPGSRCKIRILFVPDDNVETKGTLNISLFFISLSIRYVVVLPGVFGFIETLIVLLLENASKISASNLSSEE